MSVPQKASVWRVLLVAAFIIPLALIVRSALNASNQNMEVKNTCACILHCMDGRVQVAGSDATKKECQADVVDVITQAGMVKELADNKNKALIDNFKEELEISVKKHGTKKASVGAHADCAVNPVSKEEHLKQLREAKKTVESWNLGVEVIMLWVEAPFKKAELVK